MGFSVSVSAAIIFISFLMAATTLYTAWDNSYSSIQAAREEWYELRLSQVHFDVGNVSVTALDSTNVSVSFKYLGQTISGTVDVLHNGIYVSSVDLGYLIPNNVYNVTVPVGSRGAVDHLAFGFDNGCILLIEYHCNQSCVVDGYSIQCPLGVG